MTKQEFEDSYIKESNMTMDEYDKELVTLPCNCSYVDCRGWAAVDNTPRSIKSHNEIYG